MNVQHVILDYSEHFLVIDGERGPVCANHSTPAYHPRGYFRYRSDAYGISDGLRGKMLRVTDIDAIEEESQVCEPADEAFRQYVEVKQTCSQVIAARYPEAQAKVPA